MPYRVRHIWVCSASGLGRHDVPFKQTLFQKNHLGPVLAILPCIAPPSQPSLIHHRHTPPITTASRHPATRPPGPQAPTPPSPQPPPLIPSHLITITSSSPQSPFPINIKNTMTGTEKKNENQYVLGRGLVSYFHTQQ